MARGLDTDAAIRKVRRCKVPESGGRAAWLRVYAGAAAIVWIMSLVS